MRLYIRWAMSGLLLVSLATVLLLATWTWRVNYRRTHEKRVIDDANVHPANIVAGASRIEEPANQREPDQHVVQPSTKAAIPRKVVNTPLELIMNVTLKYIAALNPPRTASNHSRSNYLKSYNTTADTYLQRKKTFVQGCQKHGRLLQGAGKVQVLWLQQSATTLCLIEKCSSTFLGQILYLLYGHAPNFYSPFQVNPGYVYGFYNTIRAVLTKTLNQTNVRHALFVRDPYSRLLSGYIDKLFTPNVVFWASQGSRVVAFTRNVTTTKGGKRVGHDVTFAELARFVAARFNTSQVDPHFTPLYSKHCITCDVSYDVIGKTETSADDLAYFLDSIGALNNNLTFSDPATERAYIKVVDKLGQLWRDMEAASRYVSPRHAACLEWRSFQIEGLISVKAHCPPGLELLPFEQAVQVALAHYDPSPSVKAQKKEALVQAYLSLPEADLLRLQKVMEPDADLFGYSSRPAAIFEDRDRKRREMASQFQYFDIKDDESEESG